MDGNSVPLVVDRSLFTFPACLLLRLEQWLFLMGNSYPRIDTGPAFSPTTGNGAHVMGFLSLVSYWSWDGHVTWAEPIRVFSGTSLPKLRRDHSHCDEWAKLWYVGLGRLVCFLPATGVDTPVEIERNICLIALFGPLSPESVIFWDFLVIWASQCTFFFHFAWIGFPSLVAVKTSVAYFMLM